MHFVPLTYIYVSVKDLAELTSEGEDFTGVMSAGAWPGVVLRPGASGTAVEQVQFWLSSLSQYNSALPSISVDGRYGTGTTRAVRAFQQNYDLTADGIVGQDTWDALYAAWVDAESDVGGTAYPGAALRSGSRGNNVRLVQFWLRLAADNYSSLNAVTVDGNFGGGTANAVTAFQSYFNLDADGVVGRATWNKLKEVALAVANGLVEPNAAPGTFSGTLREGSSGTPVRELQYYLRLLAAYYSDIPTVTVDGSFGSGTRRAVVAWQQHVGLQADGIVGRLTWQSIYQNAAQIAASGPVARVDTARAVPPGEVLALGDSGAGVLALSRLLLFLSNWLPNITPTDAVAGGVATDVYDEALQASVLSAQRVFGLPQTGTVGEEDWNAFYNAAVALYTVTPAAARPRPDGVWPGYTLAQGSAGPAVLQVQRWLNVLGGVYCGFPFVEETGVLDAATLAVLEQYQIDRGLSPIGVVDNATWERLQADAAPFMKESE